jgi:hypothetical protein
MSAITIRIYTINPETGQRSEPRTVRHPGQTPRASDLGARFRWPDCACPQHRET